jgi:hypothetical protein
MKCWTYHGTTVAKVMADQPLKYLAKFGYKQDV